VSRACRQIAFARDLPERPTPTIAGDEHERRIGAGHRRVSPRPPHARSQGRTDHA
jgi:hypothetical protein